MVSRKIARLKGNRQIESCFQTLTHTHTHVQTLKHALLLLPHSYYRDSAKICYVHVYLSIWSHRHKSRQKPISEERSYVRKGSAEPLNNSYCIIHTHCHRHTHTRTLTLRYTYVLVCKSTFDPNDLCTGICDFVSQLGMQRESQRKRGRERESRNLLIAALLLIALPTQLRKSDLSIVCGQLHPYQK